jgi:sulfite exporter TauE/SafE
MTELQLINAFLLGFLGSSHCVVMCGGFLQALQLGMATETKPQQFARQLSLSLGRLTTYSLFGAIAGALGYMALSWQAALLPWLRLLSGLILVVMALYISRIWVGLQWLERKGTWLWQQVQPLSRRLLPINSNRKAYGYGMIWGFLPCGLVYTSLSWSVASASPWLGASWMLAFGIGTLPAVLAMGTLATQIQQWRQLPQIRIITACLLAGFGLYTIYLALSAGLF